MNIVLNGKIHQVPEGCLVSELIALLKLQEKRLAVEINQEIVPRSQHTDWQLQSGDKVEIVHAIGGGERPLSRRSRKSTVLLCNKTPGWNV